MTDPPIASIVDQGDLSPELRFNESNPEDMESYNEPNAYDMDTNRIVFELFDRDGNGFIEADDLAVISSKLGRDPEEGKVYLTNLFA